VRQTFGKFAERISDYDLILAEQLSFLRKEMGAREAKARGDLEKFRARLEGTKLTRAELGLADARESLEMDLENIRIWGEVKNDIEKVQKDCQQFDMPVPEFEFGGVQAEVDAREAQWAGFTQF
jgi:hypothetical protein